MCLWTLYGLSQSLPETLGALLPKVLGALLPKVLGALLVALLPLYLIVFVLYLLRNPLRSLAETVFIEYCKQYS